MNIALLWATMIMAMDLKESEAGVLHPSPRVHMNRRQDLLQQQVWITFKQSHKNRLFQDFYGKTYPERMKRSVWFQEYMNKNRMASPVRMRIIKRSGPSFSKQMKELVYRSLMSDSDHFTVERRGKEEIMHQCYYNPNGCF